MKEKIIKSKNKNNKIKNKYKLQSKKLIHKNNSKIIWNKKNHL